MNDNNINILNGNENLKNILKKFELDINDIKNDDIISSIEKFKKFKSIIENTNKNTKNENNNNENNKNNEFIYAAIPFINEEYQKSIYIAIKIIELKKIFDMNIPSISIQSKNKMEKTTFERRKELLNIIKKYISKEDADKIDNIIKIIELKKIINLEGEIFL